jgi:hypothetical protein
VMIVDWKEEFAQSYIAHARSSGRLRPRRSRRLTARGSRLWRKFGVQRFWVRPACGLPVLDGRESRSSQTASVRDGGRPGAASRAAVSVATNIVEGCARASTREYAHFVNVPFGSAAEAQLKRPPRHPFAKQRIDDHVS